MIKNAKNRNVLNTTVYAIRNDLENLYDERHFYKVSLVSLSPENPDFAAYRAHLSKVNRRIGYLEKQLDAAFGRV